jgi:hypothetical protein
MQMNKRNQEIDQATAIITDPTVSRDEKRRCVGSSAEKIRQVLTLNILVGIETGDPRDILIARFRPWYKDVMGNSKGFSSFVDKVIKRHREDYDQLISEL